jgi:hypothetical protein
LNALLQESIGSSYNAELRDQTGSLSRLKQSYYCAFHWRHSDSNSVAQHGPDFAHCTLVQALSHDKCFLLAATYASLSDKQHAGHELTLAAKCGEKHTEHRLTCKDALISSILSSEMLSFQARHLNCSLRKSANSMVRAPTAGVTKRCSGALCSYTLTNCYLGRITRGSCNGAEAAQAATSGNAWPWAEEASIA